MTELLFVLVIYALPPALVRWSASRWFLRSFDAEKVRELLRFSWFWACFAAPLAGVMLLIANSLALSAGGQNLQKAFDLLPVWSKVALIFAPYVLLCLGYDWWLAVRTLRPRDKIARKRVALWVLLSNLLGCAWIIGLCEFVIRFARHD